MAARALNIDKTHCQLPEPGVWQNPPRVTYLWSSNEELKQTKIYTAPNGASTPGQPIYVSPAKASMAQPTLPTILGGARPAPMWCILTDDTPQNRMPCGTWTTK